MIMFSKTLCILVLGAGLTMLATSKALSEEMIGKKKGINSLERVDESWSESDTNTLSESNETLFNPPDISDLPEDQFGELVREGLKAFMNPSKHAKEYVGNDLACTNCHLDAGMRAGAAPMWGAYPLYPKYRSKNKQVNTMEMRIQGCFRYSMNGSIPPADGPLMKSYLAYFSWMSQGAPIGTTLSGQGFPPLETPEQTPDRQRGKAVYEKYCVVCHQLDGQGVRQRESQGWLFPPLWGKESYNWGAGMHDPNKAAAFIKRNMPWGRQNQLSDQQAWDVATYINSFERPQDPRFSGDVQETRQNFHSNRFNLYGTKVDGQVLGENAY